ncbi:myosin-binding protein 1-like isoform X2 [Primulina eburnea]|uniref:myosin-binding protein 1-like isoform X2 n=1 Tax=Primulina eburnea TaxID=1245227 RepID=UPI003C6CAABB
MSVFCFNLPLVFNMKIIFQPIPLHTSHISLVTQVLLVETVFRLSVVGFEAVNHQRHFEQIESFFFIGDMVKMETRQTPKVENEQKASLSIASSLVSAVHEWLLIFMLFIDAIFSYLVTTFARYFRLQIPCLLCSRLDHILGKERAGFVWDLLCNKHKLKVSSLVFCKLHNNLVDVHGTCENCFFSSAETKNEPNAETYRLLIGKFGNDPQHWLDDEYKLGSCNTRMCCCCNELRASRNLVPKFFGTKSTDSEKSERSKLYLLRNEDADLLSHVEYAKVKVTSDTESETQISDDESRGNHIREIDMPEQDSAAVDGLPEPQITTVTVCPALEEKSVEPDGDFSSGCNVKSKVPLGHGSEEVNWHDKNDVNTPSDLISFTEATPWPTVIGAHFEEPKETNYSRTSVLEQDTMVEHGETSKMGNNSMDRADLMKEKSVERGEISVIRGDPITANETQIDPKPSTTDSSLQIADSLELVDAYRLAIGARGRQLSGKLLEQQMSMKEFKRASEDLKLLFSQISPARGIELFLNESPRMVNINNEDYISMDDSSPSLGVQLFQRRISLERNESSISLDGSTVSEIEGESLVDRLKRQVAHDKKIMGSLYKELEEERNASSIAANQTMAMITRLQEEKSSIHMEASQYLRLMEEQAEYDGEAFQQVNDLLVEKEKRIQCLEEELEQFKNGSSNNFFKQSSVPDVPDQETEKHSILKSLEKLEEKLFVLSKDEVQLNDTRCTQEPVGIGKNNLLENTFMNRDSELGSIRYELSVIRKRLEELDV